MVKYLSTKTSGLQAERCRLVLHSLSIRSIQAEPTYYMSVPFGVTLSQPIFGVNNLKWQRRIEPIRYKEAKAAFLEDVERVTLQQSPTIIFNC